MLAVAIALAGCQAAGPQGLVSGAPVVIAGDVVEAPAAEMAENLGTLRGVVLGPSAAAVAELAGAIASDTDALLGDGAFALVVDEPAPAPAPAPAFKLLTADSSEPVPNAVVTVRNRLGEPIAQPVTTDAKGRFELGGLRASGPVVFVSAAYSGGGADAVLEAAVSAPRDPVPVDLVVDGASTLLAKKLSEASRVNAVGLHTVSASMLERARQAVSDAMTDHAALVGALFDDNKAARALDAMLGVSAGLRGALTPILVDADLAGLLVRTAPRELPPSPKPRPTAPAAPLMAPLPFMIFDEVFTDGWAIDETWNGEAGASSEVTPASGATAIAWNTAGRGGFKCAVDVPVSIAEFRALTFMLRASSSGLNLQVQALEDRSALGHPLDLERYGDPPVDEWKRYTIPFTDMATGDEIRPFSETPFSGFMLLEMSGQPQPTVYIDHIGLVR